MDFFTNIFSTTINSSVRNINKKNINSFGKGSEQITSIRNIHKGLYDHSAFKWRATGTRSLNECFYYVIDDRLIIKRLMDTCKII